MQREILKADGTSTLLAAPTTFERVCEALGNAIPFTVRLPDGWVMIGDDNAIAKRLPVNEAATKLYHSVCKPGTTHQIRGNVVVTLESDFGDGDDF